ELGASMALVTLPVRRPDAFAGDKAYMGVRLPGQPGNNVVVDWAAKPEGDCPLNLCPAIVYAGPAGSPASFAWATVKGTKGPYGWWYYHYAAPMPQNAAILAQVYIA